MDKFLTDTNIIESKVFSEKELPTPLYFSAVIFGELMTACNDRKELKRYQKAWKDAGEENFLVVPTESDWLEASRDSISSGTGKKKRCGRKITAPDGKSKTGTCLRLFNCRKCLPRKYNRYYERQQFLGNQALSQKIKTVKILRLEKKRFENVNFKPLFYCI